MPSKIQLDKYKGEIEALYLKDDKSIRNVLDALKAKYGEQFNCSERTLKENLKNWKFHKNLVKDQANTISRLNTESKGSDGKKEKFFSVDGKPRSRRAVLYHIKKQRQSSTASSSSSADTEDSDGFSHADSSQATTVSTGPDDDMDVKRVPAFHENRTTGEQALTAYERDNQALILGAGQLSLDRPMQLDSLMQYTDSILASPTEMEMDFSTLGLPDSFSSELVTLPPNFDWSNAVDVNHPDVNWEAVTANRQDWALFEFIENSNNPAAYVDPKLVAYQSYDGIYPNHFANRVTYPVPVKGYYPPSNHMRHDSELEKYRNLHT